MKALFAAILALVCALVPVPMRSSAADQPSASESQVDFSFDQVDIRTFVKVVGDLTGRRFIVDENVQGKITVVTPKLPVKNVYPLFLSVLDSAGCAVSEGAEVDRVIRVETRAVAPGLVVGPEERTPETGLITKVIQLKHVSAEEIRKMLESKLGTGKKGAVGALESTNHLIVTDTAENIRRIEKIVMETDKPGLTKGMEVVPLKYADSEEMARQLTQALIGLSRVVESRGEQIRDRLVTGVAASPGYSRDAVVVAAPHSNSLILVGAQANISELKRIIQLIDVDVPSGRGRLNVIFLKYIPADEMAKNINALLTKSRADAKTPQQGQGSGISIEGSTVNNALLVDATPRDFELVQSLVEQLDKTPQQVQIEVMIAEVSLTDELDVGVEMAAVATPSKVGDSVVQGSLTMKEGVGTLMNAIQSGIFPRGITVGVAHGAGVDAEGNVVLDRPGVLSLDAVQTRGKFKLLSRTGLGTQDNQEASVNIVNNIPVLRSTISGGTGTARDIIQNIERLDVGIKLKITPHVNPTGDVQMKLNPSIEAVVDPGPSGVQFAPTIAKREVSTTVTVPDGSMAVISGLTREDQTKTRKQIPILGSIPLLGALFRHTVDGTSRTSLLIFVSPRVVPDAAAANTLRQAWEDRTGISPTNAPAPIREK